ADRNRSHWSTSKTPSYTKSVSWHHYPNAEPLLMQIRLPANYGRRYNEAFSAIYPKLAKEFDVPLLPFFMEEVYLKPQWMQDDGIHPNRDAQPFIADWMAKQLQPLVNHDS
ncbi:SGNH/GDSL hydrolase family protein, partial [Escherichia coli]|uniref:SGNH/GDSL hydrolase family protein n=1 Tax=Escherichia coli TaxID=562 RepID=UPI0032AFB4CE